MSMWTTRLRISRSTRLRRICEEEAPGKLGTDYHQRLIVTMGLYYIIASCAQCYFWRQGGIAESYR